MLDVETGNKIRSLSIVCPCLKYVQSLSNVQSLSTLCPPIKMWYSGGLKNCWTGYGQTLDTNIQFLSKYLLNKLFLDRVWTNPGCIRPMSVQVKLGWTSFWQTLHFWYELLDLLLTELVCGQTHDRDWTAIGQKLDFLSKNCPRFVWPHKGNLHPNPWVWSKVGLG